MPISRFDISSLSTVLETRGTLLSTNHTTVLTPNHRTRDAILDSYPNDSSVNSWRTPHVYAIDVWLKRLWRLAASQGIAPFIEHQILESIEEHFIWTSIIENSLDTIPLLNPDETAAEASRAYQTLRQWLPDNSTDAKLESYRDLPDIGVFLNWKKSYSAYCNRKHLISLVDYTHKLIAEIDKVLPLLPTELVLVNFFQPPPLYQLLFASLQPHVLIHNIPSSDDAVKKSPTRDAVDKENTKFEFSDIDHEITACATWAKKLSEDEPNSHIGILFNEDDVQRDKLARLFASILYPESQLDLADDPHIFNTIVSHHGLMDAALVQVAFQLLELNNEQQQSSKLCNLLQSPHYLGYDEEIESRIQLELYMRANFSSTCTVSELVRCMSLEEKNRYCPKLASALLKTRTMLRESARFDTAANWAKLFIEQLSGLGWPGNNRALTTKEKKFVQQLEQTIAQFSHSSIAMEKLNLNSALSRLKSLCSKTRQPLRYERACQFSLYTINEAIGLKFDHVWLVGLDDHSWPPCATPSSFLPYALQKEAGIPGSHSDIQYQLAKNSFDHLKDCVSSSLIASYPVTDGDQQLRPSPFIANFRDQTPPQSLYQPLTSYANKMLRAYSLEQYFDCDQFPLVATENPQGGQGIISNQSSCPFRAFARHRLHAEPLAEFESGLGSMARGTAIHLSMEHVYKEIDSLNTLSGLSAEKLDHLIQQAANIAIEYLCRKHRELMTPRFRKIEQQRVESLLLRFIELEKQRFHFTVAATEKTYQWQLGRLNLKLKVDRIDTLLDGSLALIDYKTGKTGVSAQRLLEDRPEDMQLPVYYSVVASQQKAPISTVQIAHINVEKTAYSGITASSEFEASAKPFNHNGKSNLDWSELTRNWQHKTERLADEFCKGIARVAPVKRPVTCQYCGLQALCRIAELDLRLERSVSSEDEE